MSNNPSNILFYSIKCKDCRQLIMIMNNNKILQNFKLISVEENNIPNGIKIVPTLIVKGINSPLEGINAFKWVDSLKYINSNRNINQNIYNNQRQQINPNMQNTQMQQMNPNMQNTQRQQINNNMQNTQMQQMNPNMQNTHGQKMNNNMQNTQRQQIKINNNYSRNNLDKDNLKGYTNYEMNSFSDNFSYTFDDNAHQQMYSNLKINNDYIHTYPEKEKINEKEQIQIINNIKREREQQENNFMDVMKKQQIAAVIKREMNNLNNN